MSREVIILSPDASNQIKEIFKHLSGVYTQCCNIIESQELTIFEEFLHDKLATFSQDIAVMASGILRFRPSPTHIEVFNAWARILDYCTPNMYAVASTFTPVEWWQNFGHYLDLNAVAINRGVKIIRIFILDPKSVEVSSKGVKLLDERWLPVMQKQIEIGIDVNVVLNSNLRAWKLRDLFLGNVLVDNSGNTDNTNKTIRPGKNGVPTIAGEQISPSADGFEEMLINTAPSIISETTTHLNMYYRRSVPFKEP
jgi:hypothetical protein